MGRLCCYNKSHIIKQNNEILSVLSCSYRLHNNTLDWPLEMDAKTMLMKTQHTLFVRQGTQTDVEAFHLLANSWYLKMLCKPPREKSPQWSMASPNTSLCVLQCSQTAF